MHLTQLAKDKTSGHEQCPSAHLGDTGELVIQGQLVDEDTMSNLTSVLPGETAVRINPQVILEAADRYRAAHGNAV